MPTQTQFCTMQLGITQGLCDLVIAPVGNGRGRIGIDRTPATSLLIALGTDRRADPADTIPALQTAPAGTQADIFSRRGYPGDVLLPEGQRLGSRAWLYERGKRDEATRSGVADAVAEAVAPIAAYHGIEIDSDAQWHPVQRGLLVARVQTDGVGVSTTVQTL